MPLAPAMPRYLPGRSGPGWAKALRVLLLLSVGITVLVNPAALGRPHDLAVTFGIVLAYSAGLWFVNGYSVDWLSQRVSWTTQPGRRLLLTLLLSVGGSVAVILGMQALITVAEGQPLAHFWRPGMYSQVLLPLGIALIVSLFNHGRSFFLQWREAAVRAERLEKETAVARLDGLRRQVDPHFLFNSLNALTSLVEEQDPARAVRFIRQLAQVYRYVLDSQSQELVPLADELRFAESYLFLQKTRLGNALALETTAPAAALAPFFVPPLAVQLLLENALKHNTALQADPLHVSIVLDPAAATLTVRNTLRPRRLPPGEASGLGLANLAARYGFLTERPLAVGAEGGEFVARLPLLKLGQ